MSLLDDLTIKETPAYTTRCVKPEALLEMRGLYAKHHGVYVAQLSVMRALTGAQELAGPFVHDGLPVAYVSYRKVWEHEGEGISQYLTIEADKRFRSETGPLYSSLEFTDERALWVWSSLQAKSYAQYLGDGRTHRWRMR